LQALQERLDDPQGFSGYDDIQQWLFQEFGLKVPPLSRCGIGVVS